MNVLNALMPLVFRRIRLIVKDDFTFE